MQTHRTNAVAAAALAFVANMAFAQTVPLRSGAINSLVVTARPVATDSLPTPPPTAGTNTPGVSTLTTRGSLTGDVTQSQSGAGVNEQTLTVAGADSTSRGNSVRLQGDVSAPVQQVSTGDIPQTIDVGSLTGSGVSTANTQGSISGAGITQSSNGTVGGGSGGQSIGVGSIKNSNATSINTRGAITGSVIQIQDSARGAVQSLTAAAVTDVSPAGQILTRGTIDATVTQTTNSSSLQTIDVGSVKGGTPAEVRTDAVLTGTVTQDAKGNLLSRQIIQIGSVNTSRGNVATSAGSSGAITQTQDGTSRSQQKISVGSAENSTTQTITEAFTTGDITQSASNGGLINQTLSVGSSENTAATVTTRALVTGNVTQAASASNTTQTINLGSVRNGGSGNITTDVQISGDISQTATGSGQRQKVIVGGVEGN